MAVKEAIRSHLIGGAWIAGSDGLPNVSPSDEDDIIGVYAQGAGEHVAAAVSAAQEAFEPWWRGGIQARAELLDRVGAVLLDRKEGLGRLLSREEGKTLPEGIAEVIRAGQIFRFFAAEVVRLPGKAMESLRPGVDIEVKREPIGVFGLITPWNFPMAIPAWKIAPALAYGNTVVIKPPDLTPACVHALAEIFVECGCPRGVFNMVMGRGRTVGHALLTNPNVNGISFTGSVEVGRSIIAAAAGRQAKVQAEMGGKNATIILEDADLDVAIPAVMNAAFGSTGQRCTATSRLILERTVARRVIERLKAEVCNLRVGHALEARSQMGPVVSEAQLLGNLQYVQLARDEGAEVIGGGTLEFTPRGFYQEPALFLNADNKMRISREEIFGPCLAVILAEDFEDAMQKLNDTDFGLSAGICTTSLMYTREFMRRAKAGIITVNLATAGVDYHVPFGGTKGSSYGPREQGSEAIEFYTTTKTAYVRA
jgi:aldehyde dehydrogenase (NAD+)